MKIEQKLFVLGAALVFAMPALATETVKPPVTPPGEPEYSGRASAVGGAASIIKFALPLVMEYGAQRRIDADITRALGAAEPRIKEALTASGDKGVLVTARHEKRASGGHGVRGETTRLVGDIAVGDTGAHPILAKMKTASLTPTISAAPKSNVQTAPGYVPDQEFNRMYWAESTPSGTITFRAVNVDKLRQVEIAVLTNQQMSAAVQQLNYAEDLTSRIRLASANLADQTAREEAAALLKEREQALTAAEEVDRWLNEELGRAARANQAANTAGTISAAAAAAAAAYGAAGGGGANGGSAPHQNPSAASNSAQRNNILIKSSTINLRSEDFLKRQRSQAPASQTSGPEVPRLR
jgi:hypothetical protein